MKFPLSLAFVLFVIGAIQPPKPIRDALEAVPIETPLADLWVYKTGDLGLKLRVLDVFVSDGKFGFSSLRGDEPAFVGVDDERWKRCRDQIMLEGKGITIVCLDDERLFVEFNGPEAK